MSLRDQLYVHSGGLETPQLTVCTGACLVSKDGKVLGRGHNMRVQKGSATLHVSPFRLHYVWHRIELLR